MQVTVNIVIFQIKFYRVSYYTHIILLVIILIKQNFTHAYQASNDNPTIENHHFKLPFNSSAYSLIYM